MSLRSGTPKEFRLAYILRVKEARRRSGLTQKQIAELLKVPQPSYAKYESTQHSRLLPHDLVAPFCQICACSIAWLISGVDDAPLSQHALRSQVPIRAAELRTSA
jgi:transcriptional regulator with XRE-family HTH domain